MSKSILDQETQQDGKFQTICKKCNCHFTFDEIDTYKHTNHDRDGVSIDTYIDCPKCSNSIMADAIIRPSNNNGFMGFLAPVSLEQKIFKLDVQKLRNTSSDAEFRRILISQLL